MSMYFNEGVLALTQLCKRTQSSQRPTPSAYYSHLLLHNNNSAVVQLGGYRTPASDPLTE
eukprot:SAG25_NODE_9583_length_367_cov_0.485075_1_plen_59_part_01